MLTVCLQNLLATLETRNDCEIIIVNDNPSIQLEASLECFSAKNIIILIENNKNLGYSSACNIGVSNSHGSYLIFLDCDIVVSSDWLVELEKTLDNYPNCGAISSVILDLANNQIVYAGMSLYFAETIKPYQGGYLTNEYFASDYKSQIVTSGCMLVSKEHFEQVGGFDEKLYNSCCDLDFSMKLNSKSWQNYVSVRSVVYHRGNVSGEIRFSSHIHARSLFFMNWSETIKSQSNLDILRELYSFTRIYSTSYLIIDMADSLYSSDYIACFVKLYNITCIDTYKIRVSPSTNNIYLTDYLSWDICALRVPILYFVDDYRRLLNNALWLKNRPCPNDVIVDKNGNIHTLGKN